MLAGRVRAVTAADLAAQYGGRAGDWQSRLAELARIETITGDSAEGYLARKELVKRWRGANPRMRHAMRADPTQLPGAHRLAALMGDGLGDPAAAKLAYKWLPQVLYEADLALRLPTDGMRDDAGITWRHLLGVFYRMRHPAGGLNFPTPANWDRLTHNALAREFQSAWARTRMPRQQRVLLRTRVRAATEATRNLHRTLLMAADLRAAGVAHDVIDPLVSAAVAGQLGAYALLAEAHEQAEAELKRVRAYPHQQKATLRSADRALADAPGTDPLPEHAELWLRDNTHELNAARRALQHGVTDRRLARARTLLERHDQDRAYAWSKKLWRTMGGWDVMEGARKAAEELERRFPQARAFQAAPTHPDQIPVTNGEVVPQPRHPDASTAENGGYTAVTTLRGPGNRTNQDAGTAFTLHDGTRVVIVADGLSRTSRSEKASFATVTAARHELDRDLPGRTREQAVRDAYAAAADALRRAYASDNPYRRLDAAPYATTLLIALVTPDGEITVGWVGDSRAYLLVPDSATESRPLTDDHLTRKIMSRCLSPDFRPSLEVRTHRATRPAFLLATTDGLHNVLPEMSELRKALNGETDPTAATRILTTAARVAGSNDDATAAVAWVGAPTQPAPTQPAPARPLPASPAAGNPVGASAGGPVADHILTTEEIVAILAWLERVESSMVSVRESGLRLPVARRARG